ncbi:MAG: helix-turn-helix domain-containing protein [Dermatophilaceae bacterium]
MATSGAAASDAADLGVADSTANIGHDVSPRVEGPAHSLDQTTYERMRASLVEVADEAVQVIIAEVPSYRGPLTGQRGRRIQEAVQLALDVFLTLARSGAAGIDEEINVRVAKEAYDLGRGEARSGRTMEALLGAYRIGARVSWRALSREAVAGGMTAAHVGQFAESVFAYIDDLSDASVAGHTDELQTSGRVRDRLRERLARAFVARADIEELTERAERADWPLPQTLTAVLLPTDRASVVLAGLDPRTLHVTGDVAGFDDDASLLLVPDAGGGARTALRARLAQHCAVLGPARPWCRAYASIDRARRALPLLADDALVDTEERLVDLVLLADPEAYDDLRRTALAPLDGQRPATRARLEETLRAWLLLRGRRELVAQTLFVHPQTVRYRMGQLKVLYGDALEDPATVLALTMALAKRADGQSGTQDETRQE